MRTFCPNMLLTLGICVCGRSELGEHGGLGKRRGHVRVHRIIHSALPFCVRPHYDPRVAMVRGTGWCECQLHDGQP